MESASKNLKVYIFYLVLDILCPMKFKLRRGSMQDTPQKTMQEKYQTSFNPYTGIFNIKIGVILIKKSTITWGIL